MEGGSDFWQLIVVGFGGCDSVEGCGGCMRRWLEEVVVEIRLEAVVVAGGGGWRLWWWWCRVEEEIVLDFIFWLF